MTGDPIFPQERFHATFTKFYLQATNLNHAQFKNFRAVLNFAKTLGEHRYLFYETIPLTPLSRFLFISPLLFPLCEGGRLRHAPGYCLAIIHRRNGQRFDKCEKKNICLYFTFLYLSAKRSAFLCEK